MKLKLHKSHGLKQASRQWYMCFARGMTKMGFDTAAAEPALFIKRSPKPLYIVILVDDDILFGPPKEVQETKTAISRVFTVQDLGPADFFLGMEITRDRHARTLNSPRREPPRIFWRSTTCRTPSPLSTAEKPTREGETLDTLAFSYSNLVGSMLYIANCTRPDMSHTMGVLARFISKPTKEHWGLVKAALSYMAESAEKGLVCGTDKLQLKAYCDADLAGDLDTRRSTSGFVFTLAGGAIS
jgi:hypothetical protein